MNSYGPAECSIWCATRPDVTDPQDIGFMIGAVGWIVDPANDEKLLPLGAIGELILEGPIVGRGYLRHPELTEESFIKPPTWIRYFRRPISARFFKSGDLLRYQSDGSFLILGRKDTQVKLRGQRLELDEGTALRPPCLAAFILSKPADRVELFEDALFSEPSHEFSVLISVVEKHLRKSLPRYIIPVVFLPLHYIPLTIAGKIDRKQLRERCERMSWKQIQAHFDTPRSVRHGVCETQLETSLRACAARVLNRSATNISLDDSFFHLGGDSIGAMELSSICRREGMILTVPDIFRYKTIRSLAPKVQQGLESEIETREKVGSTFALSPIQQAFFDRVPDGEKRYNQSFLVRLRAPKVPLDVALSVLVRRHAMLRARFRKENGCWQQILTNELTQSFRYRYLTISGAEIQKCFIESQDAVNCLDGPMLVVDRITDNDTEYLYLVAHHLVVDLVS
ncbi:hypothetical protein ANO14919_142720 [Xylariales sp. No.14919]|nr:hypothetical protein ANO14919_142720 [Xylariales sp. No.14919]